MLPQGIDSRKARLVTPRGVTLVAFHVKHREIFRNVYDLEPQLKINSGTASRYDDTPRSAISIAASR